MMRVAPARQRDRLQLPLRAKSDAVRIGRPEWRRPAGRARNRRRGQRIERPKPEHLVADLSTPTNTRRLPFGEIANRPTPPSVLPAGNCRPSGSITELRASAAGRRRRPQVLTGQQDDRNGQQQRRRARNPRQPGRTCSGRPGRPRRIHSRSSAVRGRDPSRSASAPPDPSRGRRTPADRAPEARPSCCAMAAAEPPGGSRQ